MKEKFIKLLKELKVMPIEDSTWNSFEIVHSVSACNNLSEIRHFINNHTKNVNGLYAYKDHNLLYIGKGKPIMDRLYSHFIETYKQVSGDRSGKWHRFFNKHHGKLKVYWIELEDEGVRKFVEHILTEEYKPKFLTFE